MSGRYGGITVQDCVEAPNGIALCYAFRTDNSGPPVSTDEIIRDFDAIRAEFPMVSATSAQLPSVFIFSQASVFASSYDAFIQDILPIRDQLPVYSQEIGPRNFDVFLFYFLHQHLCDNEVSHMHAPGDTWIYGVPSDPLKNQQYREILRARVECYESGMCVQGDPVLANFTRFIIKPPEHTVLS